MGLPAAAAAQQFDPFGSVQDRPRPEYSTPPLTVGAFEISPRIEAQVEFFDNLFASDLLDVDDVVTAIKPSVAIADRRSDREIRLNLATGFETYLNGQASDRFQASATGRARFGIGTLTRPFFAFEMRLNDSGSLSLSESGNIAQPLRVFSAGANGGLEREFGPFVARLEGRYKTNSYNGDIVVNGARFDGSFRDYDVYGGRARLAYSVNPAQRIYVEARFDRFDYAVANNPPAFPAFFLRDRSADNFSVRAGYERQITELLQIDVNAGYAQQLYDDPVQPRIRAFSFEANAYYSPTPLTRLRLQALRSIDDTVNPLFSSFLRTEAALYVEHELRRNVVLTAQGRYSTFAAGGGVRLGDEYQVSAGARYFISPRWSLRVRGEHFERTGVFPGSQNRGLLGVVYNF